MRRREFIAFLLILGFGAALGGCSLISFKDRILEQPSQIRELSPLAKFPAPKTFLGIPVPEGMDHETFNRIVSQAFETAAHKMYAPRIARFKELLNQDPYLVEAKKKLEEIRRKLGDKPDEKVLLQAISSKGLSMSEIKRRVKEIEGKLEAEGFFIKDEGERGRRRLELTRAELKRLFAEWEQKHKK